MQVAFKDLVQIGVALALFIGMCVGIALILIYGIDFSTATEYDVRFTQYQGAAKQYYDRMGDFTGVCVELGLPDGVLCADDAAAYRILERDISKKYFCGDHTGFMGIIDAPPASKLTCRF